MSFDGVRRIQKMENPKKNERLEVAVAILIALVSLTTALITWRTANLGSRAGDLNYQGLLDAARRQQSSSENWRTAYEEAGYARQYLIALAGVYIRGNSPDPTQSFYAAEMSADLLPSLQGLGEPIATDTSYLTPEGQLDVQKLFDEMEAQDAQIDGLVPPDPLLAFHLADIYFNEQRWLVVGTILIAISLFWLGLSQVTRLRVRTLILVLGILLYGIGLVWSVGVELAFFIQRGGAL
jgi:hypothetical protein